MENEIWKSISGYEGMYEVSDLGNLRSLERQVNHPRKVSCTRKPRPCQLVTIKGGYYQVRLHKNGVERRFLIHRLVMYSFRGVKLLHVDHINGIRTDNRLLNLRYCTMRKLSDISGVLQALVILSMMLESLIEYLSGQGMK